MTRRILPAVLAAAALLPAVAAPELPSLEVQRQVARRISLAGSAALAPDPATAGRLPGGAAGRAWARALWRLARGEEEAARRALVGGLSADADPDLRAAMAELLVDLGPGAAGREALAAPGDAAPGLLYALSREGRCDEVRARLEQGIDRLPAVPGARVLAARALARCGLPGEALALLAPVRAAEDSHRRSDPRVSLAAGEILLAAGDSAAARAWCEGAADRSIGLPLVHHRAAACAAAAAAREGFLPGAYHRWIAGHLEAARDPALPARDRVRSALAAAWAALDRGHPGKAAEGLEALDAVRGVSAAPGDRATLRLLRGMLLLRMERVREGKALLRSVRREGEGDLAVLGAFAAAMEAEAEGDVAGAVREYGRAEQLARGRGIPELVLAAVVEQYRLEARPGDAALARLEVLRPLREWPGGDAWGNPWADPGLPRRAVQVVLDRVLAAGAEGEAQLVRVLSLAEELRSALGMRIARQTDVPEIDRLQRQLAAQDAGMALFVLGETRSWAFFLKPGEISLETLPAGDTLREWIGPLGEGKTLPAGGRPQAGSLVGPLANFPRDAQLLIVPDGFLFGVPWAEMPAPGAFDREACCLGQLFQPAVLPSLARLLAAFPVGVAETREEAHLLAVGLDGLPGIPGDPRVPGLVRFASFRAIDADATPVNDLLLELRGARDVLHLGLPLLLAGREARRFVLGVHGTGHELSALSLDRFQVAGERRELVVLDPRDGFADDPVSRARAACLLVGRGARAAVVSLADLPPGRAATGWKEFYGRLGRGKTVFEALRPLLEELRQDGAAALAVVGRPDVRVVPPPRVRWPFWASLGAALAILAVVSWRLFRRPRDPFDVEPPEAD